MTAYEKYKKQRELQAIDSFADHVIKEYTKIQVGTVELERLVWKKPDSSFYAITFTRWAGTLVVTGDCYEAVYRWSEKETLTWIADTDFSYFHGKCVASRQGAVPKQWEANIAQEELESHYKDGYFNGCDKEELDEGMVACDSKDALAAWIYTNSPDNGELIDMLGAHGLLGGEVPDVMCYFHWWGLRMAMAKLKEQEDATPQLQVGSATVSPIRSS